MFYVFLFMAIRVNGQNIIEKKLLADKTETISINGFRIFKISVSTSKTEFITIKSALDGEYQNQFQVVTKQEENQLDLKLEQIEFSTIADDKRNAHKVVAATLYLEIPEGLNLNITSNIGSVHLSGNFDSLYVDLLQGYFDAIGEANSATIITIDGHISLRTKNADVEVISKNGRVTVDEFITNESLWKLHSINGNITVAKQE